MGVPWHVSRYWLVDNGVEVGMLMELFELMKNLKWYDLTAYYWFAGKAGVPLIGYMNLLLIRLPDICEWYGVLSDYQKEFKEIRIVPRGSNRYITVYVSVKV